MGGHPAGFDLQGDTITPHMRRALAGTPIKPKPQERDTMHPNLHTVQQLQRAQGGARPNASLEETRKRVAFNDRCAPADVCTYCFATPANHDYRQNGWHFWSCHRPPTQTEPDMDHHLEQIRLRAAEQLAHVINTAAHEDRGNTLIEHALPAADALASYAIAALVSDPEGSIAKPAIAAAAAGPPTKLPPPAPEP